VLVAALRLRRDTAAAVERVEGMIYLEVIVTA
jgi:hypothetical protein